MEVSSPAAPAQVKDGTGADIYSTPETHQLSANWTVSADPESGISKYWYKIGTTPGGTEVMDWIDNGTYTYVTVTRTNLSLVRGTTYYFTVKAQNGIGLVSGGTSSDGQCVDVVPGYITFNDNFESGSTGKWDTTGSGASITQYNSDSGTYSVKCALVPSGSHISVKKLGVNSSDDMYMGFKFKLGANFTMSSDRVALLRITNAGDSFAASVFLNYFQSKYLLNCEYTTDDNKWPALPGGLESFCLGYMPEISANTWYRVDIHTRAAGNRKGGAELWLNGVKQASLLDNYNTTTKAARNIEIGAVSISSTAAGDIYFDDIYVSDSLLGSMAVVSASTGTPAIPPINPPVTGPANAAISAYPNPFLLSAGNTVKFKISPAGSEIRIYTVAGRLVKKLVSAGGAETTSWNGTNETGERVSSGIYIYRIADVNGGSRTGKLAVIKLF